MRWIIPAMIMAAGVAAEARGDVPKLRDATLVEVVESCERPCKENGKYLMPKGFQWGLYTSAVSLEDCNTNDHDFCGTKNFDGSITDKASGHGISPTNDANNIGGVGGNSSMLSLSWAVLQNRAYAPLDLNAVNRYRSYIDGLRRQGIEDITVVLSDVGESKWFVKEGGWLNPRSPDMFADYAKKVAIALDGRVNTWFTIESPWSRASQSYWQGSWPPYNDTCIDISEPCPEDAEKAFENMIQGHDRAYKNLKQVNPNNKVGLIVNWLNLHQYGPDWKKDLIDTVGLAMGLFHKNIRRIARKTKGESMDMLGVIYSGQLPFFGFRPSPIWEGAEESDEAKLLHDDMYIYNPRGLKGALSKLNNMFKVPMVIIHSNATKDDGFRRRSMRSHLGRVYEAVVNNIPVVGYFTKAMDGYEAGLGIYQEGVLDRYGRPKPSAKTFREMSQDNAF